MIITCKKDVPFRWIAFAILPWASFTFNGAVVGTLFIFSLKKFIENPAGVTFILSLPSMTAIVLQPVVSFLSDRIWTRFGRRKPFIVTSLTGVALCLILMPLMPNFWALLAVFLLYNSFADLNSPMEPLKQEIIPPHERGRATGAMTWCSNLATMTFYFIALGRFDDVSFMEGVPLNGETVIYWSAAILLLVMVLLITLGIREVNQKSDLTGEPLSFRTFPAVFFGGLLDRELWPVYLLVVGAACMNFYAGLGPLSNLLYTDQWGYTKQEMGINVAVGGIINLFAIGLLTLFADKLNRMKAYQTLICLSLITQVCYYCYIEYVLPDHRPTLVEIIVFGETISILAILTGLVYTPLVYDYVRRNKMGTYNAGAQMMTRLTVLITLNGVGLFVWGYAVLFQPPAGDMTRVVLRGEGTHKAEVRQLLSAATWTYPDGNPATSAMVTANAWQVNGTISDTGRAWEIRLRDPRSEELAAEKDKLAKENSPLVAEDKMLRDEISSLQKEGRTREAAADEKKAEADEKRIAEIKTRTDAIQAELKSRADKFQAQVAQVLGSRMIAEGEQVLGATKSEALVVDLPTTHRAEGKELDKILAELRKQHPEVIDLRPLKLASGYGVAVSAILPAGTDAKAFEHSLQEGARQAASVADPKLFPGNMEALGRTTQPAVSMDLMIVEEPLDSYVSPITRVVNFLLSPFVQVSDPGRRLVAVTRNLRVPTETNHVRVEPGPAPKTLTVTVVLPETAAKADSVTDPLGQRLQTVLGKESNDRMLQVRALYDRIEKAAATQRITVARPTLTTDYAAMKYDYMSGYLWMFVMGSIGILITIAFKRVEAKGLIRKRGVEEAAQS